MGTLKVLIRPENDKLEMAVNKQCCERIRNIVTKLNEKQKNIFEYEEPDFGLNGFQLVFEDQFNLIVNKKTIFYNCHNITEVFPDNDNKVYNILLRKALEIFSRELGFYLELDNHRKSIKKIKEKVIVK